MKKLHFLILSIIIIFLLCILAFIRINNKSEKQEDAKELTQEQLFVLVNADTLVYYLNEFIMTDEHPSLNITKESNKLVITHNQNAHILLNRIDNNMSLERKKFSSVLMDKDGLTTITLEITYKDDGSEYVKCPAPILADVLRIKYNEASRLK